MIIVKLREKETPPGHKTKSGAEPISHQVGSRSSHLYGPSLPLCEAITTVVVARGCHYVPILLLYEHQDGTNLGLPARPSARRHVSICIQDGCFLDPALLC